MILPIILLCSFPTWILWIKRSQDGWVQENHFYVQTDFTTPSYKGTTWEQTSTPYTAKFFIVIASCYQKNSVLIRLICSN